MAARRPRARACASLAPKSPLKGLLHQHIALYPLETSPSPPHLPNASFGGPLDDHTRSQKGKTPPRPQGPRPSDSPPLASKSLVGFGRRVTQTAQLDPRPPETEVSAVLESPPRGPAQDRSFCHPVANFTKCGNLLANVDQNRPSLGRIWLPMYEHSSGLALACFVLFCSRCEVRSSNAGKWKHRDIK